MSLPTLSAIQSGLLIYQKYSGVSYDYHCFAVPGTALTAAGWSIRRMPTAGTALRFAGGNAGFTNVATDLAAVEALSYS